MFTLDKVGTVQEDNAALLLRAFDAAAQNNETLVLPKYTYYEPKPIDNKNPSTVPPGIKGRVHIIGESPDSVLEVGPKIHYYDEYTTVEFLRLDGRYDFDFKMEGFTVKTPMFKENVDVGSPGNQYSVVVGSNYGIGKKGKLTLKDMKFLGDASVISIPDVANDADDELDVIVDSCDLQSFTSPIFGRNRIGRKRRIKVVNTDLRIRGGARHYGTYITQDFGFDYSNVRIFGVHRCGIKVANSHAPTSPHTKSRPEYQVLDNIKFIDCKDATGFVIDEYTMVTIQNSIITEEMGAALEAYGQFNFIDNTVSSKWGISAAGINPQPNTFGIIKNNLFTGIGGPPNPLVSSPRVGSNSPLFTWLVHDNIVVAVDNPHILDWADGDMCEKVDFQRNMIIGKYH